MKGKFITLAALGLAALTMGGCASQALQARIDAGSDAYGAPVSPGQDGQPTIAYLGAGDQLGSAIFVRYLASIRGDQDTRFATGTLDSPESD